LSQPDAYLNPMKRLAAILLLCALPALAQAQVVQSFPGVAPSVPAPPLLPVPPPVVLATPQTPPVAGPSRHNSFSDRVTDCLHQPGAMGLDPSRPPGEDRDSYVRQCANGN
jgi:hypothetical protein